MSVDLMSDGHECPSYDGELSEHAERSAMRFALLHNGRAWFLTACVMLVALGGLGLLLSMPGYRPQDFLVRRMESQVRRLTELDVLPHVRRMADLGDAGVSAAVRLLASERQAEIEAAEAALSEQLDRWRLLPAAESAPRATHLASELRRRCDTFPPRSRRFAGELAVQLLLWPVNDASQAEKLLAQCEQVLRQGATRAGEGRSASSQIQTAGVIEIPPLASPPRQELFPRRTMHPADAIAQ